MVHQSFGVVHTSAFHDKRSCLKREAFVGQWGRGKAGAMKPRQGDWVVTKKPSERRPSIFAASPESRGWFRRGTLFRW